MGRMVALSLLGIGLALLGERFLALSSRNKTQIIEMEWRVLLNTEPSQQLMPDTLSHSSNEVDLKPPEK